MSLMLDNSVLEAAEQKIESGLLPANRANYMKIVVAGMKTGMANGPNSILNKLRHSNDPVNDCAKGAVNLAMLMYKHTQGAMPFQAMIPAAMTLMLHGLDFVDKSKIMKIGAPELDKATQTFMNTMFHNLGVTPAMLAQAHDKVTKAVKDPAYLEAMKQKAGLVKSPNASTPTPTPEGDANGV
jgi:hypothetical protein